jgi:hypothetical protein
VKTYDDEMLIYTLAQQEASKATQAYLDKHPDQWYPCGFAWVKIRPANGSFVKAMKEADLGSTDDYAGGFQIYNPSGNHTQCMDAKYEGAEIFAEILNKWFTDRGMKQRASAQSRID